jgi:hypothetical protein
LKILFHFPFGLINPPNVEVNETTGNSREHFTLIHLPELQLYEGREERVKLKEFELKRDLYPHSVNFVTGNNVFPIKTNRTSE